MAMEGDGDWERMGKSKRSTSLKNGTTNGGTKG